MNWQDVMIKHFGANWLQDSYSLNDIAKLAEDIINLNKSLEKALDAVPWDSYYFDESEDE